MIVQCPTCKKQFDWWGGGHACPHCHSIHSADELTKLLNKMNAARDPDNRLGIVGGE